MPDMWLSEKRGTMYEERYFNKGDISLRKMLMIYVSSLQDIWERVVMLNAEVSDS